MKTILYAGACGTSGYAIATKNQIFNYLNHGYKVTYVPLHSDNSRKTDIDVISSAVNSCIGTVYDNYDEFIINYIPDRLIYLLNDEVIMSSDLRQKARRSTCKRIIKTVWETTRIPPDWVAHLNGDMCDEVWLPSNFNKKAFIESGVTNTIRIDKYISYNFVSFKYKSECKIPFHYRYGSKNLLSTYNFYYISTWNDRKNNTNTLRTFCETFDKNDNVSLLMKTNDYDYNEETERVVKNDIEEILKEYPNHPNIIWFPKNYETPEMNEIHNLGDCYYLLHRGEGLGYSSYDAYLNHKPVITTGFGGHCEYFTENYPYLVNYTLRPVFGMKSTSFYQHSHQWAEPDYDHAKHLLKTIYEKYR